MIRPPPNTTRTYTRLPYTTLFRSEIEPPLRLVDAHQAGHFPRPAGQRDKLAVHIMIEMPVARSFGPPDQAAVRHRVEAVRQVDPALRPRFLGKQHARCARRGIDDEHVEPRLIAILALDIQRIDFGRPMRP